MLSPEDQRRFAAIERELASEDPDLARRLRSGAHRDEYWHRVVPTALIVLGAVGIVAGLLTLYLTVFLVGGIAPLCAGLRLRRRLHGNAQRRPDQQSNHS